jgi:hypothetical protein
MNDPIIAILTSIVIVSMIALAAAMINDIRLMKKNLDILKDLGQDSPVSKKNKHKTMQTELDNLIAETKGKFFSITFVKKDGSVRVINGKDKYQRLLKGGEYKGATAGFVPFVNRNTETWASAHKDAIVTFRCGKLVKQVSA